MTFLLIVPVCSETHSQESFVPEQVTHDFDYLWSYLRDNYAYFDQKETDWDRVRQAYRPKLAEVKDQIEFVTVLERVLDELYDPHTHLKVNTSRSTRLIPSGPNGKAERPLSLSCEKDSVPSKPACGWGWRLRPSTVCR